MACNGFQQLILLQFENQFCVILYQRSLGDSISGQRMHAFHMLILPLIPVMILDIQNGINYATHMIEANEIISVQTQVIIVLTHV
jgi:hypothetical protein